MMNCRKSSELFKLGLFLIVALPIFLLNLGSLSFFADEATRAVVALEMKLSGNYLLPTIAGQPYYNKPPLFNWLAVSSFSIFSNRPEFALRLLAIIPLFVFAITIYLFIAKFYSSTLGFITALAFMTTARILFYDSLLGHIDILFSLVCFTMIMLAFHFCESREYLKLFAITYILCAIVFLLKGLPAILMQGITLLVLFWEKDRWKVLFSWTHLVGVFVFLIAVLSYYLALMQNVNLDEYFATLFA